jgi:adenylate cyclase
MEKLFGQQVSPAIVDEIIKNKQEIISRKRNVCVLFLDIRGFTPYCEDKSPEEIITYQNDVFSFMIEIITNQKGIINQFMGDGFMATFGAPISTDHDCQHAVNAAIEIIEQVKQRSADGRIAKTKIGIGVHTGEAVTGNVGTTLRKQYSITGHVVILAARLEQLNKKYRSSLLISYDVFKKVKIFNRKITNLGKISIKGRKDPLEVYQID